MSGDEVVIELWDEWVTREELGRASARMADRWDDAERDRWTRFMAFVKCALLMSHTVAPGERDTPSVVQLAHGTGLLRGAVLAYDGAHARPSQWREDDEPNDAGMLAWCVDACAIYAISYLDAGEPDADAATRCFMAAVEIVEAPLADADDSDTVPPEAA